MANVDQTDLAVREQVAADAKAALAAAEDAHRSIQREYLASAERVAVARAVAEKASGKLRLALMLVMLKGDN